MDTPEEASIEDVGKVLPALGGPVIVPGPGKLKLPEAGPLVFTEDGGTV